MTDQIASPDVKVNRHFATEEAIIKYNGTPHGLTLIAFSLADAVNKGLRIELGCVGESQLIDFSSQIRLVLQRTDVIKVIFRNVTINEVPQTTYEGIQLTSSYLDQGKTPVFLDIEVTPDQEIWRFHRSPENEPRVLRLYVK